MWSVCLLFSTHMKKLVTPCYRPLPTADDNTRAYSLFVCADGVHRMWSKTRHIYICSKNSACSQWRLLESMFAFAISMWNCCLETHLSQGNWRQSAAPWTGHSARSRSLSQRACLEGGCGAGGSSHRQNYAESPMCSWNFYFCPILFCSPCAVMKLRWRDEMKFFKQRL